MSKLKFSPTVLNTLHSTDVIPTVLMLSPTCTDVIPQCTEYLHCTDVIPHCIEQPPQYWRYPHSTEAIPPHVLLLSPTVLKVSLHSTEYPPQCWCYPPQYWCYPPACTDVIPSLYWTTSTVLKLSPTVLNNLHSTEAISHSTDVIPPMYWTTSTVLNRRYMGWPCQLPFQLNWLTGSMAGKVLLLRTQFFIRISKSSLVFV